MHMQHVRAQEERLLCDTCNAILILPFTLQHLCNTRVTVENIHEITSDVVIMIIAVLLCLSPRDSGRVYHLCGALKCNVCLHRCHMSPWRPMSPSQLYSTATHSITGGRQRGLYQNIDRNTHCMLHRALVRIWLILIMYQYFAAYVNVHWYCMVFPFFEPLSIAMCWHYLVLGTALHVYRQCARPDQQQTEDTTQSGHHGGGHMTPQHTESSQHSHWYRVHVTVSPPLLLPIFRLVGSICVSETGAGLLWCCRVQDTGWSCSY